MSRKILSLLIAIPLLIVVLGILVVPRMGEGKGYFTTMLTYSAGRELIATTNSSLLVNISPELHAELSQLLTSTTHIASVRLGDEPKTGGNGQASSRIVLTNDLMRGLMPLGRVALRS